MNQLINDCDSSQQHYCVTMSLLPDTLINSRCHCAVVGYVSNVNDILKLRIRLELVSSDVSSDESRYFDVELHSAYPTSSCTSTITASTESVSTSGNENNNNGDMTEINVEKEWKEDYDVDEEWIEDLDESDSESVIIEDGEWTDGCDESDSGETPHKEKYCNKAEYDVDEIEFGESKNHNGDDEYDEGNKKLKKKRMNLKKRKRPNKAVRKCPLNQALVSQQTISIERGYQQRKSVLGFIASDLRKHILSQYSMMMKLKIPRSLRMSHRCYNPTPLILLSSRLIDKYIDFNNAIILHNPTQPLTVSSEIYYSSAPYHVGKNLTENGYSIHDPNKVIKVERNRKKKIALLARWDELRNIVMEMNEQFLPIYIPDCTSMKEPKEGHLVGTYLLIMFGSNMQDRHLPN